MLVMLVKLGDINGHDITHTLQTLEENSDIHTTLSFSLTGVLYDTRFFHIHFKKDVVFYVSLSVYQFTMLFLCF